MLRRFSAKYGFWVFLFSFLLLGVDRLLKYVSYFQRSEWSFLNEFFIFRFVPNYHLALGLPLPYVYILLGIGVFLSILLGMYVYFAFSKMWLEFEILSLLLFGAFSNLYDRLIYGFVIDYFSFSVFPIFNIADVLIVVGGGLYAWLFLKEAS